jgi:hypothetical protein
MNAATLFKSSRLALLVCSAVAGASIPENPDDHDPVQTTPCTVAAGEIPFNRELAAIGEGCLDCTCIPSGEFLDPWAPKLRETPLLVIVSGMDQWKLLKGANYSHDNPNFFLMPMLRFIGNFAFTGYQGNLIVVGNFSLLEWIGESAFENIGFNVTVKLKGATNLNAIERNAFKVSC